EARRAISRSVSGEGAVAGKMKVSPIRCGLGMAPDVARNLAVVRPRRGRAGLAESGALAVPADLSGRVLAVAAAVAALEGPSDRGDGSTLGVGHAASPPISVE